VVVVPRHAIKVPVIADGIATPVTVTEVIQPET
jgi:hypothetical protein